MAVLLLGIEAKKLKNSSVFEQGEMGLLRTQPKNVTVANGTVLKLWTERGRYHSFWLLLSGAGQDSINGKQRIKSEGGSSKENR